MSYGTPTRLRALTLLVALAIGLLGQIAGAVAMPTTMLMPQDPMSASGLTDHSGHCPAYLKQRDVPSSTACTPGCITVFCSVLPAVIPSGSVVAPFARRSFPPINDSNEMGICIRPNLGPPRSAHQS